MNRKPTYRVPGPDEEVIFRPWITLKNGKRLYARQVGIEAFPLIVKKNRS